ncbi:hypothetical protein [Shewanella nanhaiensis]|uniref:Lipoprotein n=1 Tax=Shewanella nanhaiensis TaxID=2864872 RepID=A0ABS7E9I3_9GAMM|nr:hypothetical protein [Shewanella nanhaiensis]MBW8186348.1 hypothetical protein [Shewanella nanhaiensis]
MLKRNLISLVILIFLSVLAGGCNSKPKYKKLPVPNDVYDLDACMIYTYDYDTCTETVLRNAKIEAKKRKEGLSASYQFFSNYRMLELFYTTAPQVNHKGEYTPYGRFEFVDTSFVDEQSVYLSFSHPSYAYDLLLAVPAEFNLRQVRRSDALRQFITCGALHKPIESKSGKQIYLVTRIDCE